MESCNIFIVEDNDNFSGMLRHSLASPAFNIISTPVTDPEQFTATNSIVIIDYNSESVRKNFIANNPQLNTAIPFIVVCDEQTTKEVFALFKTKTFECIVNTGVLESLLLAGIKRWYSFLQLNSRFLNRVTINNSISASFEGISDFTIKTRRLAERASSTDLHISITGEVGTGKLLLAKAIHENSSRQTECFKLINLASLSAEAQASKLFGDVLNTGALEKANNGTLCIKNIDELSGELQIKLYKALEQKELQKPNGEGIPLNVRIIAISKTELAQKVDEGLFNEKLFDQLILPIELLPLRKREEDILYLAYHFLQGHCNERSLPPIRISTEAQEKLLSYNYPANTNELKKTIELAAAICINNKIKEEDIIFTRKSSVDLFNEEKSLRAYNIQIISHYLNKYNNNIQLVANKLEIGKSTIYKMMQNKEILV